MSENALNQRRIAIFPDVLDPAVLEPEDQAILVVVGDALLGAIVAASLDRDVRNELLDAGASAVFERHSDITLYRREAASIVAFWVRNQRLDAVGT